MENEDESDNDDDDDDDHDHGDDDDDDGEKALWWSGNIFGWPNKTPNFWKDWVTLWPLVHFLFDLSKSNPLSVIGRFITLTELRHGWFQSVDLTTLAAWNVRHLKTESNIITNYFLLLRNC